MKWIENFSSRFSEALEDRISKPFGFSFLISWCLVNYATILAAIGSGDYKEKIRYISAIRASENFWMQNVLLPLAGVAIYLIVIPIGNVISVVLVEVWEHAYTLAKNLVSRQKFVPLKELGDFYTSHDEKIGKYRDQLDELNSKYADARKGRDTLLAIHVSRVNSIMLFAVSTENFNWKKGPTVRVPPDLVSDDQYVQQVDRIGGLPLNWLRGLMRFGKDRFNMIQFAEAIGAMDHFEADIAIHALIAHHIVSVEWTGVEVAYSINNRARQLFSERPDLLTP